MNPPADYPQSRTPQRRRPRAFRGAAFLRCAVPLTVAIFGIALGSRAAVVLTPEQQPMSGEAARSEPSGTLVTSDPSRSATFDLRSDTFVAELLQTSSERTVIDDAYASASDATPADENSSGRLQQIYSPQSDSTDPNRAFETSMVVTMLAFLAFGVIGMLICAAVDD